MLGARLALRCWIMVDITSLTEGLALFKSGMDGLRAAIGVARDIRGAIPEGQRNEINRALEQSERQLQIAEAQIAMGLGYTLCECEFPPTPMLTVGWIERGKEQAGPPMPAMRCHRQRWGWVDDHRGDQEEG
jgi:hypothetical protein